MRIFVLSFWFEWFTNICLCVGVGETNFDQSNSAIEYFIN